MSYNRERAERLQRDDMPLMGYKEGVRYASDPGRITLARARKDDLIFLLGILSMLGMAWWIVFRDTGGLPQWFACIMGGLVVLIALGCGIFLFWSPHIVFDMLRGRLVIKTWRVLSIPYLSFGREEIRAFELFEERLSDEEGVPVSEPLYYYIYLLTADGIRLPLVRFYERGEVDEFRSRFAEPSSIELAVPAI